MDVPFSYLSLTFVAGLITAAIAGHFNAINAILPFIGISHVKHLKSSQAFTAGGEFSKIGSIQDGEQLILKRHDVEEKYPLGTWQREAYENFVGKITNKKPDSKTFPCIYAGRGYRADELHFLFLYSDDLSDARNVHFVATALRGYLHNARATGLHTSLVILTPNDNWKKFGKHKSLQQYRHEYWEFARKLRQYDPKTWPNEIPQDTQNDHWCWCFEGIQCFMGVMTPSHVQRQTRQADNLCVVYQPKWIFQELFKTDERRNAAAGNVRSLIQEYDTVPISPDITHYGTPGSSEARQHFLWDENIASECPFGVI